MTPEVRQNIAALPFNYTTWVLAALGYMVAYWLDLKEEERQALLTAYPWLKHAAALGSVAAYVIARIAPQAGVKPIIAQPEPLTAGEVIGRAGEAFPATLPMAPMPGAYSPEDIDALLRVDRLIKAQRAAGGA